MLNPKRMEAFLGHRFSPDSRQTFAAELEQGLAAFKAQTRQRSWIKRHVHLQAKLNHQLAAALQAWMGDLMRIAENAGFTLSDLEPQTILYDATTYPKHHQPLPASLSLPASSYHLETTTRHYIIHVVLPNQITGIDACLTSLRAWLFRLYGNIYLHDQVYTQAHYLQDRALDTTLQQLVGFEEKVRLLATSSSIPKALLPVLRQLARQKGIPFSLQRVELLRTLCTQWCQGIEQQIAQKKLSAETLATVEGAFEEISAPLQENLPQAIADACQEVERVDQQLRFIPAERLAEFGTLQTQSPFHALGAAQARLQSLFSVVQSLVEDANLLLNSVIPASNPANPNPALSKEQLGVLKNRLENHLASLIQQQLARPYLLAQSTLPAPAHQQVEQFPLEVFRVLQEAKKNDPSTSLTYEALQKRMENSIYQRIYSTQSTLVRGIRLLEQGGPSAFLSSIHHQKLRTAQAYFKARFTLLHGLCTKVNLVVQLAEQKNTQQKSNPLPLPALAQGWAGFISHGLVVSLFCLEKNRIPAERYWKNTKALWHKQMEEQRVEAHLSWLFYRMYQMAAQQNTKTALHTVRTVLLEASKSLRFAVHQCCQMAQNKNALADKTTRIERLAKTVYYNYLRSQKNAIVGPHPIKTGATTPHFNPRSG